MIRKQFLAQVKSFIAQHDLDLQHSVLLLGGSPALMRLQRFRQSLTGANGKSLRLARELNWLHDLLSLEHVADIDREESAYFAMIDLDDQAVWAICTLTEAVSALIVSHRALKAADDGYNQSGEVAA